MTKTILDIINRTPTPAPWSEGDNIPWDDPEFSERMLQEHLTQEHDLASRKSATIDRQVAWIHSQLLDARPAKVLDLACGPGLYTTRLARKGCTCVGIDFSPASIRHAKELSTAAALPCTYHHADVRDGRYGDGYHLAMMLYGQLNVFQRPRALEILQNAHRALEPGGQLLLELQSEEQLRAGGQGAPSWYSAPAGLFSSDPHIVLQENFWDESARASTHRFSVIEGTSGHVRTYAMSNEAYSQRELTEALELAGFTDVRWFASLLGKPVDPEGDLPVVVARK